MGIGARQESDFFVERRQTSRAVTQEQEYEQTGMLCPADSKQDAAYVVEQVDMTTIQMLFEASARLSSTAIVDFVISLVLVALEEIHAPEPRIFCSEKVVEVAYYNMDRIRIVWSKIWQQMSQHFYKAGCHPNLRIAMYAVDSLRQLAIKFLEKEELVSYQFQREFLNPFVLIIENNSLLDVHELVIRCLTQIVQVRLMLACT